MSAQGMPPQILALFAPRMPLEFLPPVCGNKPKPVYNGIASYIDLLEKDPPPPVVPFETPKERKDRIIKEKLAEFRKLQDETIAAYDPHSMDVATKNPYASLFVGRLSYEVTEKKLKKEFESYGPIKRVKIITDFNGKSRGYAFVEFETEEALKTAYKQGDGKKIDGRRVLVDVERSRTVPGWIPRRLGGGKGPARFTESKKKAKTVNVAPPSFSTHSSMSSTRRLSDSFNERRDRHSDARRDRGYRRPHPSSGPDYDHHARGMGDQGGYQRHYSSAQQSHRRSFRR